MAVIDLGILITAINRTVATFGRVEKDLNKVDKNAKKAGRSLRAIDLVLSSIALGSGIAFAKSIVRTAEALEKGRIRMALFAGSFEEGRKQFQELREQFKSVPIDTQTMLNGFSRLKAAGLDPLGGSLLTIVDAVSAFGGGTDEINRTIIAIQQIAGKGVLSMEELRQQLGETVPFALSIMARETERTIPEFISAVENGMVSAQEAITAFITGAEESFGGFSEIMGNTISGGTSNVKKEFENLVDRVFGEGLLDTRIGIFLNNVAAGIAKVAENITQADIDKFTRFLENIVIVGGGAIQAIGRIASMIVFLIDAVVKSMGSFGTDLAVSGLIGFMLFGRMGVGAALIFATLSRLGSDITVFTEGARQLLSNILGDAVKFGLIGFFLFGRKGLVAGALLSFVANVFLEIADSVKLGVALIRSAIPEFLGGINVNELERLVTLKRELASKGQTISGQGFADLFGLADPRNTGGAEPKGLGTSGDNFFARLLGSKGQAQQIRADQQAMLANMASLNAEIQDATKNDKARKTALKSTRDEMSLIIALERARNQSRRVANRIEDARRSISVDFFKSKSTDAARNSLRRLSDEIGNVEVKIATLRKKQIGATLEQQEAIGAQIIELRKLQGALREVAKETTATAILSKGLWESVGETLSDTVKGALSSLAQGTLDLQQIQLRVWASLTDAAANYLVELAKIALKQAAISAFGGGTGGAGAGAGGGGFLGSLGAIFGGFFANGGALAGGTSLGQGIVRGPTLFAAGEGGDEGVLPLANVGGKMGVNASGMGGGQQLHLHLNAIDAKSGTEFLIERAPDLHNILRRQARMTSE